VATTTEILNRILNQATEYIAVKLAGVQYDDTDKLAVSLYGRETDAGDVAIRTNTIGCLVSMDIKHWHLHMGRLFTAHIDNAVTNIGEMTVIAFNVPATGSFHLSSAAYSSHIADLNFYEDTSIDVDEGVDLVPLNRDRNNIAITTTMTTIETTPAAGKVTYFLEAAAATANITKTTELDHEIIVGGEGPRALGATGGDDFGFELGNSKQYAVILTAGTNDDATHHLTVSWCEYVG
jgi:hypothetical protein